MEKSSSSSSSSSSDHTKSCTNRLLWDCNSSLYDSFELKSFEHHLGSAIAASSTARTFSMPHLSVLRRLPSTKPSRIASILRKLVRSLLFGGRRRKRHNPNFGITISQEAGFYYVFYDKSGTLSTIPEGSEYEGVADTTPLVRKTASERFTASTTSFGIYRM